MYDCEVSRATVSIMVPPLYHCALCCAAAVGGNSLYVALIDSVSVAIVCLWLQSTPTIGVNSLGLNQMIKMLEKVEQAVKQASRDESKDQALILIINLIDHRHR